jgi:PAS domain S-box-containing protein
MDLEGQCTFAKRSATKMTGYSFEELKGRSVHNLIHSPMNNAESCPAEQCCVLQSMKTGIGCRVREDIFWRKDGSYFPVEYSSYPIFDNEQITGAVVTFNDITERKKADDELRDAKEQADLYLDLLGHDINNMNQVCISYLEIAQHKLELKNEQKMLIRHPLETMKISSKLIHNVMQIRNAKTNNLHQKIIDLGTILSEAKAQFKIIPNKDVTINYNPVSGCRVIASELLRDVFANIIGNAIKHSGPSVTINMGVAKIEHHGRTSYKVTIEDNGPGINQEFKQLVFNKFTKGPTTVKSTGLGLYLSKTLIEQFQGMIEVEDRVPGDHTQGSKFVVIIPTAD